MMSRGEGFRVLLVGAGEQALESRGPSLRALEGDGVLLSALASPGEGKRTRTAARLGIERTYHSLGAALESEPFDGVVLASPTPTHEPLCLEALAAGSHVLCEKPIATDAGGGRRMIEAAERAGRVLAIGYHYPWMHPGLVELAAAGHLDSVFRASGWWLRSGPIPPQESLWDRRGIGAANDLLGHLLSVVLLGIASNPVRATAYAWNHFGRAAHGQHFAGHDSIEALIGFERGEVAHLRVAWEAPIDVAEAIGVTLTGPELSLEVPLIGRELEVEGFRLRVQGGSPAALPKESVDRLPVQTEDTFVLQARDWVRAACEGGEPRFAARDALTIQAVLDAAIASALEDGETIPVRDPG